MLQSHMKETMSWLFAGTSQHPNLDSIFSLLPTYPSAQSDHVCMKAIETYIALTDRIFSANFRPSVSSKPEYFLMWLPDWRDAEIKIYFIFQNSYVKVGSSSMQGWRISMEDAHTHILALNDDPNAAFFGGKKSPDSTRDCDVTERRKWLLAREQWISLKIWKWNKKTFKNKFMVLPTCGRFPLHFWK
jgi:hypothetical protein